ncbi:MAG: endonuclease III, partial [Alphaproteobacteria bacterium]|nr:endonuclease III [Alphaproteobacteria bacterium]
MTPLMTSMEIEQFFEKLSAQNPHPKGELYSVNSFTLLVAVVLSAQ